MAGSPWRDTAPYLLRYVSTHPMLQIIYSVFIIIYMSCQRHDMHFCVIKILLADTFCLLYRCTQSPFPISLLLHLYLSRSIRSLQKEPFFSMILGPWPVRTIISATLLLLLSVKKLQWITIPRRRKTDTSQSHIAPHLTSASISLFTVRSAHAPSLGKCVQGSRLPVL